MSTKFNLFLGIILLSLFSCETNNKATTEETAAETTTAEVAEPAAATTKLHYICYKSDKKPNLAISIAFDEAGKAQHVTYKGQAESLDLVFVEEKIKEGQAASDSFYDEMYEGGRNGRFKLTHSGNWDYAEYTRGEDGKVFKFTIDHDLTVQGGTYRETPCYGSILEETGVHNFSSEDELDQFKITVFGESLLKGAAHLTIKTASGKTIYTDKFPTNSLLGYDLPENPTDADREAYLKAHIADFFKHANFHSPAIGPKDLYEDAGLDKAVWDEIEAALPIGFSYRTSPGSSKSIAFSKKTGKAVAYSECC